MKHGKYSKTKEVRPYKVIEIIKRYDGVYVEEHFCRTQENAKALIEFLGLNKPQPNEYYFGTEYKIEFIGSEKYI